MNICCFTNSVHCRELGAGDGGWGDGGVVGAHQLGGEQHARPRQLRTKIFLAMKLIRWSEQPDQLLTAKIIPILEFKDFELPKNSSQLLCIYYILSVDSNITFHILCPHWTCTQVQIQLRANDSIKEWTQLCLGCMHFLIGLMFLEPNYFKKQHSSSSFFLT